MWLNFFEEMRLLKKTKQRKKVNNTSFEKCLTSEYCLTFYHVTFLTFSSAAISQSSPLPLGATKFFFLATKIKWLSSFPLTAKNTRSCFWWLSIIGKKTCKLQPNECLYLGLGTSCRSKKGFAERKKSGRFQTCFQDSIHLGQIHLFNLL